MHSKTNKVDFLMLTQKSKLSSMVLSIQYKKPMASSEKGCSLTSGSSFMTPCSQEEPQLQGPPPRHQQVLSHMLWLSGHLGLLLPHLFPLLMEIRINMGAIGYQIPQLTVMSLGNIHALCSSQSCRVMKKMLQNFFEIKHTHTDLLFLFHAVFINRDHPLVHSSLAMGHGLPLM